MNTSALDLFWLGGVMKNVLKLWWWRHSSVNTPQTINFHTLIKGQCYGM